MWPFRIIGVAVARVVVVVATVVVVVVGRRHCVVVVGIVLLTAVVDGCRFAMDERLDNALLLHDLKLGLELALLLLERLDAILEASVVGHPATLLQFHLLGQLVDLNKH